MAIIGEFTLLYLILNIGIGHYVMHKLKVIRLLVRNSK